MKAFFEFVKSTIATRVPSLQTIRMWNDQFANSNDKRIEKPFKYPACFIEFMVINVANLPLGIMDYTLTVRFRFGRESYKFERLETFDFCDAFLNAMQLLAPTHASGLTFTTFQQLATEFDENFTNVEVPYIDYRTVYRSTVAYKRAGDSYIGPLTPHVIGEVIPWTTALSQTIESNY